MFNKTFKVVVISNGIVATHYLQGKKRDVMKEVEDFKKASNGFEMFGKKGMTVWM